MIDKRSWQRVEVDFHAECSHCAFSRDPFPVRVINLNKSGMCLLTPMELKLGHKFQVMIKAQMGEDICLMIKVVWSGFLDKFSEYRAGVKIVDSDPENLQRFLVCHQAKLVKISEQ